MEELNWFDVLTISQSNYFKISPYVTITNNAFHQDPLPQNSTLILNSDNITVIQNATVCLNAIQTANEIIIDQVDDWLMGLFNRRLINSLSYRNAVTCFCIAKCNLKIENSFEFIEFLVDQQKTLGTNNYYGDGSYGDDGNDDDDDDDNNNEIA